MPVSLWQNWLDGPPDAAKYRRALGGDVDGMAARFVALRAEGVVRLPEYLSFAEAATLPCAAVTAWSALRKAGGIAAGSTVLIQGTGGVSDRSAPACQGDGGACAWHLFQR